MVVWLMAEAVKAEIGVYAKSGSALFLDMASKDVFAVDLVAVYAKPEFGLF